MKTYGEILASCEAGSVTSVPQPVALAHLDYYGIVMGHGWQDAIASRRRSRPGFHQETKPGLNFCKCLAVTVSTGFGVKAC